MARPKKQIDEKQVYDLASYGCTTTEIADFFDVDISTVGKRFSKVIAKGRSSGKTRLRKAQINLALKGNASMLIWLGKNMLGQSDSGTIDEDMDDSCISFDGWNDNNS